MTIEPAIVIGLIGASITAVISYFLRDTLRTLKDAVSKLNGHDQRLSLLEQSIIALNMAIAKMSDIEVRLIQLEQNKNHELLAKDFESVKKDIDHMDKNLKQFANNSTRFFDLCNQNTQNIESLIKMSEKHESKFQIYDENILRFYRDFELTKKEHA